MSTAPASAERRLEALEAEAFRASTHHQRVTERLEHITNAMGDLSQDVRAFALDIREIRSELADLRTQTREGFTAVQTEMRDGFAAIAELIRGGQRGD